MATVIAVVINAIVLIALLLVVATKAGRGLRETTVILDNPVKYPWADRLVRLAFMTMGPVALFALTLTFIEFIPGPDLIFTLVVPVHLMMILLGWMFPRLGRKAFVGFLVGFVATVMYDVVRLLTTYAAGLPDFVPHMGELMTADANAAPWVGYAWRLFGNGAGLGIIYAMLPEKWFHTMKGSLIYGEFLNFALLGVLLIYPVAQLHLVILTGQAVINSILGHWAYGLTLFWLYPRAIAYAEYKPGTHRLLE